MKHDGKTVRAFLRDKLAPLLDRVLWPDLNRHSFDRYRLMKARYPALAGDLAARDEPPSASPESAPLARAAGAGTGLDELFSRLRETRPS